jgi:putative FmdB family regulatory protein
MPTYDYKCDDCGYAFELFQGMMEKKLTTCPKCRGSVRRLIGAGAGVVFRGAGFYETDYRSAEYRQKKKEESKRSEGDSKAAEGASTPRAATESSKSDKTDAPSKPKKSPPPET